MKHHFADVLERGGDYWTITPNRERYRAGLDTADEASTVVTLFASDADFQRVQDLPNLEELTLHEPTQAQLEFVAGLVRLKRLRISHAKPKDLGFIEPLVRIEELVLEYVSKFSDLSPLRSLPSLRALHLENVRKVRSFGGLAGLSSLRHLSIRGTLDWKQPMEDFEFLYGLPNLEVLAMWQVINKSSFPATLPVLSLSHLEKLSMPWNVLAVEECALLEEGLPHVDGTAWGPWTEFHRAGGEVWLEFTGKGSGATKKGSKNEKTRCAQFAEKYAELKKRAAEVIDTGRPTSQCN